MCGNVGDVVLDSLVLLNIWLNLSMEMDSVSVVVSSNVVMESLHS